MRKTGNIVRKILLYLVLAACLGSLTGCDVQIIEDKNAKYELEAMEKEELKNGKYYVKEGTKFYILHELEASSRGTDLNIKKCAWAIDDEKKIPNYYKNELIAHSSVRVDTESDLVLERYKDCGYSIGVHGAVFENGYISFSTNTETIKNTSAEENIKNENSPNIMVETINGIPVSEEMLNEAGILIGLEKDAKYELGFYAGTTYMTAIVQADTHFFQSYEAYKIGSYNITKNGYISITLPEDLECGYYRLAGAGFFRYFNFIKGESDIASVDYNVPYYKSEEEQLAAFSQQFTFQLDTITSDMSIYATFDPASVTTSDGMVQMLVTAPNGEAIKVEVDKNAGEISCDMKESISGKWIVNIAPQSMKVKDIEIVSNEDQQEATKEVYILDFKEPLTGVVFTMEYEGYGDVTAQIIDEKNNSYDMVAEKNLNNSVTKTMTYQFAYLPAGEYKIHVYHYPDTKILGAEYYLSEEVREIEIITIEE